MLNQFSQSDNPIAPFVSVIIPAYNDLERLKGCLGALERQVYTHDRYEVIVVDNGSQQAIAGELQQFPHAISLREERPGSYVARNAGLRRARGDLLAFTDSDCVPAADWLACGVRRLLDCSDCGLVAGRVNIFYRNPDRPTWVELYERVTAFPQQKFVQKYHFGATANIFTRRAVVDAVGPFDAALLSGGDREWGQRVHAAGFTQVYADEVCVEHPARHSFGELYRKTFRTSGGLHDLHARPSPARFVKSILRDAVAPWKDLAPMLLDSRLPSLNQRAKAIVIMFCMRYTHIWVRANFQFGRPARVR